jgi:ComF family protein
LRARSVLKSAGQLALGLIYPPTCIACQGATGEPHRLCPACWSQIRFIEKPYCRRLGTPFSLDYGMELLSPAAIADPPVFERARAAAVYDDLAARLVSRLKYGDRLELARPLGELMTRAGRELLAEADVIVPVPLHRWRLWQRRFNQAMALARVVSAKSAVPCDPLLLARVRHTARQVGLTRAQRRTNLQGAFRVPDGAKAKLAGKRVLLVDDVLTTGSTGNAASRALLRGGAARVDVLTFATVVTEA